MFKNVRYLYKMLGTTDISKIGNGTCTGAISSLNSGLANKYFIKIMKSDWSGIMGSLMPMFNINNDNMIDLIAHNEQNDTYPGVRVARASADYDGNNIPDTYLKSQMPKIMYLPYPILQQIIMTKLLSCSISLSRMMGIILLQVLSLSVQTQMGFVKFL